MTTQSKTNHKLVNFCENFLNGKFGSQSNDYLIENMLDGTESDLESIVMNYAHGSCHDWSTALLTSNSELRAYCVFADDIPIHSFVSNKDNSLALDANGIHRIEALKKYWEFLAQDECEIEEVSPDFIYTLTMPSHDEISDAQLDIELWVSLSEKHINKI